MKPTTWRIVALTGTVVLATSFLALALTGATVPVATESTATNFSDAALAPGEAALRATISPETGRLEMGVVRAGIALDAATRESLRRDTEGLKRIVLPDGTVFVHLQGRYQSVSVVSIDENGKRSICSENVDQVGAMYGAHTFPISDMDQTLEVR